MPEICRFFGIIILMNYNDHNPPHFHAVYGDQEITVDIHNGLVKGEMSKRALSMIFEWYELHREELLGDWNLARQREPLKKIQPLE
jgi:hypothetical protein